MKKILAIVSVTILSLLTCCASGKPAIPTTLTSSNITKYSPIEFNSDYAEYIKLRDAEKEKAKILRNRILNKIKTQIDQNYYNFESDLFFKRATQNILFDFTELGVAVTTNITNGERVKSILAASLTGFRGTRLSIDKNIFREKTIEAIISKMRASRTRLETRINEKKISSVEDYELEQAFGDLITYFYAGTLQQGLQELTESAAQDVSKAKADAIEAELKLSDSKSFESSKNIRAKIALLAADLKTTTEKRTKARATIIKILDKFQIKLGDDAKDEELLKRLQELLQNINRNKPEDITTLEKALETN